jgi:hypothetical protein
VQKSIDKTVTYFYNIYIKTTKSADAMKSDDFKQRLSEVTLEQAQAWSQTNEKFTYCIDILEISAHDADSDFRVNALENRYLELLHEAGIAYDH